MKLQEVIQIKAKELMQKIQTEALVIAGNTLKSEEEIEGMLETELKKNFINN